MKDKKKKTAKKDKEPDKKVGCPPLYETAEELQSAIEDYFKYGIRKKKIIVKIAGKEIPHEIEFPTITGLCYHIGFESRQSFYDLEKQPKFSYTIKRARLFIEGEYELLLGSGNVTGAIFALKNFGWRDHTELDLSNKDGSLKQPQIIISDPENSKRYQEILNKLNEKA